MESPAIPGTPKLSWQMLLPMIILAFIVYQLIQPEEAPPPVIVPPITIDQALVPAHAIPQLNDDMSAESLSTAIEASIAYYDRRLKNDPDAQQRYGERLVKISEIRESLSEVDSTLKRLGLSQEFFDYIRSNFEFLQSNTPSVLFTGYYQAQVFGSRKRSDRFRFPLYRKPDDLLRIELRSFFEKPLPELPEILRGRLADGNKVVPYYSRQQIDYESALKGKDLELVWLEDPIALFFLQVQGSAVVKLVEGGEMQVGYAESNGRGYRAIGRYLIDKGVLERDKVSMQTIVKYLREHPDQQREVMTYNPSYVFFREVSKGPRGSLDEVVTAGRSIATDSSLFPNGSLALIKTEKPIIDEHGNIVGWKPFERLVLNQDTGGAIRGPGRVDLFCGAGPESELISGAMKQQGQLYFLLKKQPKTPELATDQSPATVAPSS